MFHFDDDDTVPTKYVESMTGGKKMNNYVKYALLFLMNLAIMTVLNGLMSMWMYEQTFAYGAFTTMPARWIVRIGIAAYMAYRIPKIFERE